VIAAVVDATLGDMCSATADDALPGVPRFDVPVTRDGYRWWYVDGISDDGRCGVVVIAFVGSVFSPYYYRARQRNSGDPENFVAINVGLYGPRRNLWAMTERGKRSLSRSANRFRVGPSHLRWRDGQLEIHVEERSAPFARSVRGRITLAPNFINARDFELDAGGLHKWQPIAPAARISVRMSSPALSWEGKGYFDTNSGERALEDDFDHWNWSRCGKKNGTSITYAVTEKGGAERSLALQFTPTGSLERIPVPPEHTLPGTGWKVGRPCRAANAPSVARTLEDTPFYSRSLLQSGDVPDGPLTMHESLDLRRFRSGWVRFLLPFRMPRVL
jgi:carotenoid 1,2-hydratase